MDLFVKICGCRSREDLELIVAAGADAVGFIFWPGSKRYVEPAQVGAWWRDLAADTTRVGVFVDATEEAITRAVDEAGLDVVQFHGGESPDFCARIQARRWKAVHLNRPSDTPAEAYPVEAFVLDYHDGAQPGGTGQAVDWDEAARWVGAAATRVVLAGGLTPANVTEAVRRVQPWGVDVSSGVESSVGVKDAEQVREFIEQCRRIE